MDPFSAMMIGSMAVDYVSRPIDKRRQRRDLHKDVKAAKHRLNQTDDTVTSNPYVNRIRERKNKQIEREALDIEASKEL